MCRDQYGCSLWGLALLLMGCRLPWLKVGPAFCSEDFSRGFINQPARQPLSCWDVIFKAQLKINCRLTLILSHGAWVSLSQAGMLASLGLDASYSAAPPFSGLHSCSPWQLSPGFTKNYFTVRFSSKRGLLTLGENNLQFGHAAIRGRWFHWPGTLNSNVRGENIQ